MRFLFEKILCRAISLSSSMPVKQWLVKALAAMYGGAIGLQLAKSEVDRQEQEVEMLMNALVPESQEITLQQIQPQCVQRWTLSSQKLLLGMGVIGCGLTAFWWATLSTYRLGRIVQSYYDYVLDKTKVFLCTDLIGWRSSFRDLTLPCYATKQEPTHTHPTSAMWRSMTATFAVMLSTLKGKGLFMYQKSSLDQRRGLPGDRQSRSMKDVVNEVDKTKIKPNDLIVCVDADYGEDVPGMLMCYDNPVLLYTFQPKAVCEDTGEFVFRFFRNNAVEYRVNGGAVYRHKVWNYAKDVVSVRSWFTTKVYQIERRKTNDHHELVLLIPVAKWRFPFNLLANWLRTDELSHLEVNSGEFNVMDIKTNDGISRSIARVGEYNCATVDAVKIDAIMSAARNSSVRLGNASVQSWIDNDRVSATVILDYVNSKITSNPMTVYPAENGARPYRIMQTLADVDEGDKPLMTSYMSPVLPATFVPTSTRSNEIAAVVGRVILPLEEAKQLAESPPSTFLVDEMKRFVELMFENTPHLAPCEIGDVYERQKRPTQRAMLAQAEVAEPKGVVETFLKAEPYQAVKDPRIITTFCGVDKREWSRFIYPLADWVVENCKWYSFGKKPSEIAELLVELCERTIGVNCADSARMDGHIHDNVRLLEHMVMRAAYAVDFHEELLKQLVKQYNRKAVTKHGVVYQLATQRASGSAETALFNSILTKFIDYLSRRLAGVPDREAYAAKGQMAGDDSIAEAISDTVIGGTFLEKAGAMMGQKVENVEFKFGAPGVNYLSRFYTDEVWYGNPCSTCDIPRALAKLHMSVARPMAPINKLEQKLVGLYHTDRHTPIIREIVEAALKVGLNINIEVDPKMTSYWVRYEGDDNWPNARIPDELEWVKRGLPHADWSALTEYLETVAEIAQLLTMPLIDITDNHPPCVKAAMVQVDDNIIGTGCVIPNPVITAPVISGDSSSSSSPIVPVLDNHNRLTTPVVNLTSLPSGAVFVARTPGASSAQSVSVASSNPTKPSYCKDFVLRKCHVRPCPFPHVQVCRDYAAGKCKRKICKFKHM